MKKVIVTGASGFVGRYCIPHLLNAGFEVHAVSRQKIENQEAVFWHQADLLKDDLTVLIQKIKPTHFLHLAWVTEHGKFWNAPENTSWLKVSLQLMKAFQAAGGVRFVTAGSCAEYDWAHGECIEGSTPETPVFLYGQEKKKFSDAVAQFSNETGLSSASGRIFLLYGPGETKVRLIPSAINSFFNHEKARFTDGNQLRDFMYVGDVAEAFVYLLDSDVQGTVNIATGNPMKIREVITSLAELMGTDQKQIEFGAFPRPAGDPDILTASVNRLKNEVGYTARTSLKEGLQLTVNWMQGNNLK